MATLTTRMNIADKITCTKILNLMVILGVMVNYMLRVNLPIAIISIIRYPTTSNITYNGTINGSYVDVESDDESNTFQWDKYQQNLIFGVFFIGYTLTDLPGGRLAEIVGSKVVFGTGTLAASVLSILTPSACYLDFKLFVVLRLGLGMGIGAAFAAIPPISNKWIPQSHRSKFMSNIMASMIGAAITLPVAGIIIDKFGWPASFYVAGAVGCLWSVAWFFLVYDSPAEHPRISDAEKFEIESKIGDGSLERRPKKFPWRSFATSRPVWGIVIAHGCCFANILTITYQLPTYMKEVLYYNTKENGLLSSLPYLGYYATSFLCSYLADKMITNAKYSRTLIRKGFTTLGFFLPAACMVILATFGEDPTLAVAMFTCTLLFNGAVTGGFLANNLDIAPSYSGTIFGCGSTLSSAGAYLSTVIVATLTNNNHTFRQWSYIFWIQVVVYTIGATAYLTCGSGELQPWAFADDSDEKITEVQPLKKGVRNKKMHQRNAQR